MVKYTEIIRRQAANCLNVFDHSVRLALKGLRSKIGFVFVTSYQIFTLKLHFRLGK